MTNTTSLIKKEGFRWSYRKKGAQVLNICTKLLFLLGFTALSNVSTALANPLNGTVTTGAATISTSGKTETINQTSNNAIINWGSFDIASGETTKVVQPGATSTEIEEILKSGQLTSINGNLLSNGRIVIINPNGTIIGKNGNINTAGFIASSAALANSSIDPNKALTTLNFNTAGNANASITNEGTITVADTGLVALVAPTVRNDGLITGNLSKIQLGAADTFGVDLYGDGLVSLAVGSTDAARTLTAENDGSIVTPGGQVTMTAAAAGGLVTSVINNTGVIEAQTLGTTNGEVALTGTGANVGVSGTIDVSGANSAGTINIGGAAQGGSSLAQSANVDITPTAVLNANATGNGNGGNVVVWSSNSTNFQGTITATGGASGGNGGKVETSSGNFLNADGNVNATAANGTAGNWLLDPNSIDITNNGSNAVASLIIGPFAWFDGGSSSTTSILNATTLQNAMNANGGMDVTVTTHNGGNITVDAPMVATQSWVGLYLNAAGNISVNQSITAAGTNNYWLTPNWNNEIAFSLNAGGSINISAPIVTHGNSFLALAQGNITDTSTINTGIGGAGLESVNGNISVGNITTTYGSIGLEAVNGTVTAGNLTMDNTTPQTGIPLWTGPVGTGLGPIADTMLLIAKNGITTGNLTANSGAADASGAGQIDTITLTTASGTGNITTGNVSLTDQAGGTATLSITSGGTLAVNGSVKDYVQDVSGGVYQAQAPTTLTANGNINITGGVAVSGLDPATCCIASAATLDVASANGNVQIGGAVDAQSQGIVTGSWGGTTFAPSTSNTTVDITASKGSITLANGIAASSDSESTSIFNNATATANTAVDLSAKNGAITVVNGGINATATAKGSPSANQTSTANANVTATAGGTISLNGAVAANSSVNTQNKTAAANSNANVDIESTGSELYFSQAAEANATSTNGTTPTSAQQSDDYNGVNYTGKTTNASNKAAVTLKGVHSVTVDATKVYGTNDSTATFSANFDYVDPLNTTPAFNNTGSATAYITGASPTIDRSITVANEQVGSYAITLGGLSNVTNSGGTFVLSSASGSGLTITAANLTISAVSDSKVYDGTTNSSGVPTASSGLVDQTVDGIQLKDTDTATQAFASKDVLGTNGSTLNVTGYTIGGTGTNNDYNVTTQSAKGTITPAQLTADITNGSSVYGNTLNAGTATLNGVIGTDAVGTSAVTINTAGNLSTSNHLNAGSYNGIEAVTLTGTDAKDYTVVTAAGSGNYTVTQRVLTASIADGSSTYGNAVDAGAVTLGNVVGSDKVTGGTATVNSTPANQSTSGNLDAGTYSQSVAAGVTGADAKDYTFAGATNASSYTVNQRTIAVASIATGSSTYGDALDPGAATLSNVVSGDKVNSAVSVNTAGNTSTSGNLNAGNFTGIESVTGISGTDAANYKLAAGGATGNYDVAQRLLTGAIADNSSTYGNTVNSGSVALGNVISGDNVSGSVAITSTAANLSTSGNLDAGKYAETATISGADAKDYTSGVTNGTYTVNQRALTASIADGSSTYGNAVNAGSVTLNNTISGDMVNAGAATVTSTAANQSTSNHLDAGTYAQAVAAGVTGTDAANYNFAGATNAASYTVNQRALTGNVADASSTYGNAVSAGAVTLGNVVSGDVVNGQGAVSSTAANLSTSGHLDAGAYNETASISGADAANYTYAGAGGTYSVNQRALTASITDGSSTYGNAVNAGSVTLNNTISGDAVNAGAATVTSTAANLSTSNHLDAGTYAQAVAAGVTGTDAANYSFAGATNAASYTVNQRALTGNVADASSTYGNAVSAGAVTLGNVVSGDVVSGQGAVSSTAANLSTSSHLDAGAYNETASISGADAANYTYAGAGGTYTVNQRSLSATIADGSSTYGDAVNAGSVTLGNVVSGDKVASGSATVSSTAANLSTSGNLDAGAYSETVATGVTGADAKNYSFAGATDGTYTVNQRSLTANVADASSTYGDTVNAGAVSLSNLVSGDVVNGQGAVSSTAANLSTSSHLDAGSYAETAALSGADAANYTIGTTTGIYAVNQRALSATIADGSSTYGNAVNAGAVTLGNVVSGDKVASGSATVSSTAANLSTSGNLDAGAYNEAVSAGVTGADAANYTFAGATSGAYTVNQRALSATIADGSSTYGDTVNTGAVTLGNVVSGDQVASGSSAVTNAAANLSTSNNLNAGSYSETVGAGVTGADAANYSFAGATSGAYTVNQRALTGLIATGSSVYGQALNTGTVTLNNTVSGDAVNAGTVAVNTTGNTSAGGFLNAGNYTGIQSVGSTLAGADAKNYTFAGATGDYDVSKAALTITASNASKSYGTNDPTITYTETGLVSGDTITGSASRAGYGTAAGENTGNYAITLGSVAVNDPANYAVTIAANGAALTISQATLTVAANNQTITQGQTVPAGTVSYSGFVNGVTVDGVTINDTAASLTTPATVASAQSGTPTSGTYNSNYTASGAVDANYSFNYTAGNLVVNAGAPTPVPAAATTDFGAQNIQFDPLGRPIISVADQSINYYPYFQAHNTNPENINISIRGNDNAAGQGPGSLANIEPAAGGDDAATTAAGLANIEPAAGGNGPGPQGHGDFSCSKDFLDGKGCTNE
jgi:filamentous hemagglutinin family protein